MKNYFKNIFTEVLKAILRPMLEEIVQAKTAKLEAEISNLKLYQKEVLSEMLSVSKGLETIPRLEETVKEGFEGIEKSMKTDLKNISNSLANLPDSLIEKFDEDNVREWLANKGEN